MGGTNTPQRGAVRGTPPPMAAGAYVRLSGTAGIGTSLGWSAAGSIDGPAGVEVLGCLPEDVVPLQHKQVVDVAVFLRCLVRFIWNKVLYRITNMVTITPISA
ncbi:hypothetical protein DPMN_016083 [Dreissena polymorpha]|uniref:Uncharacterized protein n=1 Tax=Dreissena polymorpha TaxID=45954 RepID=A0A9D4S670_DREPO|nr:hypothetical protein DPMN_016083 [Dreissena polymorpha]